MSFIANFEKVAAIPNKFEQLKKFINPSNIIAKYFSKKKLEDNELRAMRTAFKNPSKASVHMDRADAYKKVKDSL